MHKGPNGAADTSSAPLGKPTPEDNTAALVKSLLRNILLTNPVFPGLYAQVLAREGVNPNRIKNLVERYQKIQMAYTNVRSCTHIKVDGVRCDSPALRGEQFCYFHQRALRQVKTPPNARLHPIALIENEEAIQASLMEVINALLRNTIDLKRAELILRALHIAVKNVRFSKFGIHAHNMVKEVPEYNEAPRVEPERFDKPRSEPRPPVPTSEEIKRFAAESWAQYEKEKARGGAEAFLRPSIQSEANGSMPSASGTGHVGTAAPGCPSGPDVPGRSAVDRLKSTTNGKGAASSRSDQAAKQTAASAAEGRSSQPPRKPPISDKAEAPKERKTTAQRASAG